MTDLVLTVQTCTRCGEEKPLSAFYVNRSSASGRRSDCGECVKASVKAYQKRKRAEMGDDAWREKVREGVARSRARGATKDREQVAAWNAANLRLRQAYPDLFKQFYREERHARGLNV